MKIQCNACEAAEATILCCADEAALCLACDQKVHAANKLASKHQRVSLTSSSSQMPKCDICQETVGYFFCLEDRALLCRKCDVTIHSVSTFVAAHQRFLLTGVRVGLEHTESGGGASSSSGNSNEKLLKSDTHPVRKETMPLPAPRETVQRPLSKETVPPPAPRETVPRPLSKETVPPPVPREPVPHPLTKEIVPPPVPREPVPRPLRKETVPRPLRKETVPRPLATETVPPSLATEPVPHQLPGERVQLSSANQYNKTVPVQADDFASTKLPFSVGTTENTQQWQLDEFFEFPELNQHYGYMDKTLPKADSGKIGDVDCSPILMSLELELDSEECLGQVPDLSWSVPEVFSPPTEMGLYWPKTFEPSMEPSMENSAFVPSFSLMDDDLLNLSSGGASSLKRRRQS